MDSIKTVTFRFTRRTFVVAGLTAVGTLVAACGGSSSKSTATASISTASTGSSSETPTASSNSSSGTASPSSGESGTPASSTATTSTAIRGGDLVIGYAQEQLTLDPPVPASDSQSRLLNAVFDPLVWQLTAGMYEPGLATSWEIAQDAKAYTFKLRDDVTFQDGTPFNAEAVKFTLDRVADPKLKALLVVLLGSYDSSVVVDNATVQVKFKTALPIFLNNLSVTGLRPVSPAAVQKFGTTFGTNVVGTGPFKLKSFGSDKIVFERFDAYKWGPASLNNPGAAYLDTVTYRIIKEDSTRETAYETGEVQFIDFTPPQSVKQLQDNKDNKVDFIYLPGIPQILQLNVSQPPLDDKLVRQAIQYAVDHEVIVKNVWFGYAKPAYGILASSTLGYWKGVEQLYPFNKEKAGALLDQAGWMMGSGGVRQKNGTNLEILYITTSSTTNNQSGELVQGMLKDVGITMKVNGMTNQASLGVYQQNKYNVGRVGEINLDPGVLAFPVASDNISGGVQENRSRYSNPAVDQLLVQAAAEVDTAKRLALYEQIQQTVMDDAIVVGQWEQVLINTLSNKLQQLTYDPLGRPMFHSAYLSK